MKRKSHGTPAGLLLLLLLRQAHTRRLSIRLWQTHSWSKTIDNTSTHHDTVPTEQLGHEG